MKTKEWRTLLRELRKKFPAESPIEVRRYPCKCRKGATRFDGRKYRVRINSLQSKTEQKKTLFHEWAHVAMMEKAFNHGVEWCFARQQIFDSFNAPLDWND